MSDRPIWIVQTLPTVFLALYTTWFHRKALAIGWGAGMIVGTALMLALHFQSSVFPISLLGVTIPVYAAVAALVVNLALCCALTPVYRFVGADNGEDATTATDYAAEPVRARARLAPDGQVAAQTLVLVEREELAPVRVSPSMTRVSERENGTSSLSPSAFIARWGANGDQEVHTESLDGHEST